MKGKNKKDSYRFGLVAEKIAMLLLRFKGYQILHSRYKTKVGEIDIVASKSKEIIFIEVKARRSSFLIEEVLSSRQINRIKRAAEIFFSRNKRFDDYNWRFDFVEVRKFFRIKHHKNFIS